MPVRTTQESLPEHAPRAGDHRRPIVARMEPMRAMPTPPSMPLDGSAPVPVDGPDGPVYPDGYVDPALRRPDQGGTYNPPLAPPPPLTPVEGGSVDEPIDEEPVVVDEVIDH